MSRNKGSTRVGYILRKFPVLSETFVLNEILAVEARGVPVHIFSMAPSRDPRFHANLSKLKTSISYVPGFSDLKSLLRYNIRAAKRWPKRYPRVLLWVLSRLRPGLVWRFLQAGYIAERAHSLKVKHFHAHFAARPTTVAALASRIGGTPYSFTAHAYDIYNDDAKPAILERKLDDAKFVVTISDYNKNFLETKFNGAPDRIVRVYNGIDLEQFKPEDEPPDNPFTIITVARLVEKKGLPTLIEACGHLKARGVAFRCWIVGKGRMRPQLDELIRKLDLRDQVSLLGPLSQTDVLAHYRRAHLYVLPCMVAGDGNRDGLPVSIVEALACGLPVVTTPTTGIPEVVRDGHNGLIVPAQQPDVLADAIEAAIKNPELYQHLRGNAHASVASNFDHRKLAEALHRLFEEVRQ